MSTASDERGFLAFYREYAHTGIHTVTATALTAFGLLSFVHRGFVALAIAVYVLPPIYLYLTRDGGVPEPTGDGSQTGETNAGGPDAETAAGDLAGNRRNRNDAEEPDDSKPAADEREPGGAATATGPEADSAEWIEADSPTEETLFDAVTTDTGAYAAGENGVLLARRDEWEVALENGPAAESTTLRGADATDEGEAVWVAGDSGVLGRYDPTTTRHTDHSAPEGITDNWADLAVAGAAGGERVALANGSGQILLGSYDGTEIEWTDPIKPGSGSSMSAIEFVDESTGYCCDTNSGVYGFDGEEFERIGVEDGGAFTALAATEEIVAVADDDGVVSRFDGTVWTPVRVADGALNDLDTDGEEWLAVGADGAIYENDEGDWEPADSPPAAELFAVAAGSTPVAVGESGTIVERSR